MTAQALYRRWRSRTFEEVLGQEHVTRTLRNALLGERIAHAYLFTGPRGTGKTTMARLLAKAVNCLSEGEKKPCNQCSICRAINEGRLLDLIEIDAASNRGIDEIRDLREKVGFRPNEAQYKIYVIDECFRYEELVTLADRSKMPIGRIVEQDLDVKVLSYNEQTGEVEPRPVTRRMKKKPHLPMVCITFDNNRRIVCTLNHKFYTPEGLKHAGELDNGQFVYANYERITQQQLAVVAGAALGDGHIALTGSKMRARLSITQGVDQKEYLDYKVHLLGDLVATAPTYQHFKESYSKKGTYCLHTLSCPQIAQLHRELYDHGRKRISRSYLDRLTPLGLALWYLDDGSLITHSHYYTRKDGTVANYPVPRSVLSTYGFSPKETHIIMQWLGEKWDIDGGISETARGPVIWLTKRGTERLHELIAPYVPPSMDYKLLEAYRGQFDPPADDGALAGPAVSIVKAIQRVTPPDFVYNIEVADNHNYFVRDILVANCHMLTSEAFNALLKTLEEPPPHVIFVLATTEPHKIPATILSRCQRFDFRRASLGDLRRKLNRICESEGIAIEEAALELIAHSAAGSFRDAESLLDQLASYGDDEITLAQVQAVLGTVSSQAIGKLVGHLVKRDVASGLDLINRVVGDGVDPRQFNRELVEYLRGLLLITAGNGASLLNVTAEVLAEMENQAQRLSTKALLRTVRLFNQASRDLKASLQPQLPLELAFIEATLGEDSVTERGPISEAQQGTGQEVTAPSPPSATSPTVLKDNQAVEGSTTQAVAVDTSPQPPTAEETPTGGEAPPASGVTLEQVRLNWARVLAEVRPHNRSAEALLRSGRAEAVEGNVVVLGFPYAFHKERVEEPRCRALVEQVFSQVLGSPCRIKCILVSKSSSKTARQPSKTPRPEPAKGDGKIRESKEDKYRAIAEDPVVRAAVDKYGAQVVDVQ